MSKLILEDGEQEGVRKRTIKTDPVIVLDQIEVEQKGHTPTNKVT
jgi:hypothetical protein